MANFTCGTCQFSTSASDEHVGRSTKCPKCGATGTITPDASGNQSSGTALPEIDVSQRIHKVTEKINRQFDAIDSADSGDARLPRWAANVIAVTFGILGIVTLFGTLLLFGALAAAQGAPQEAAAGAIFSALFIAGYLVARSVEKFVRAICRR